MGAQWWTDLGEKALERGQSKRVSPLSTNIPQKSSRQRPVEEGGNTIGPVRFVPCELVAFNIFNRFSSSSSLPASFPPRRRRRAHKRQDEIPEARDYHGQGALDAGQGPLTPVGTMSGGSATAQDARVSEEAQVEQQNPKY